MNNAINILSNTPQNSPILFDLYTLTILFQIFRHYQEKEPEILTTINDDNELKEDQSMRRQILKNTNEDLEMMSIFLEMNNEVYYDQIEKPLCYQRISNRESMKGR